MGTCESTAERENLIDLWQNDIQTSCAWIAVPMPNASELSPSFIYFAFVAQLAELVHKIYTTEAGTNNKYVSLQLFHIVLVAGRCVLMGGTNVCPEMDHGV